HTSNLGEVVFQNINIKQSIHDSSKAVKTSLTLRPKCTPR
ncbi:434_t:CDS:1, partial [Racocetra persica]